MAQPFPMAGAFNDDLVAGVGLAVQGAVAQNGIVEETEPFLQSPVASDGEAGCPVSVEDELVKRSGLLGGEPVESQSSRMSGSGVRLATMPTSMTISWKIDT